jgi:colicin import membrane protein
MARLERLAAEKAEKEAKAKADKEAREQAEFEAKVAADIARMEQDTNRRAMLSRQKAALEARAKKQAAGGKR